MSAYQPVAPQGFEPHDPLVNPPDAGINGWFNRISGMFKRSWKSMAVSFTITYLVPSIVYTVIVARLAQVVAATIRAKLPNQDAVPVNSDLDIPGIGATTLMFALAVVLVLILVPQMAGYAAATYAVTREAIGQRVPLGEALGYGLRRSLGLVGWGFASTFSSAATPSAARSPSSTTILAEY
jgi:hypothetical protein